MKQFIYILSTLAVLAFATSCEESLAEFNVDPNNPSEVALNLQLPELLAQAAFNEGTNPNRVAGIVVQQFIGLDAQQLGYNAYQLPSSVMNNYWTTGLYAGTLRSADVIIKNSEERPIYGSIAKIIMANELGKATSMFGDLPYSQAFQGTANLKPTYDSQESIYASVQTLLDEAIAELDAGADGYFGGDLVYDGDASLWAKAAHGMKARYYLQTSKRNSGDLAKAMEEASLSFTSNNEAGGFQFGVSETANWSLAKFGIERPATLGVDARFAEMLNGDPRQDVLTSFDGTQWTFFDGAQGSLIWGRSDAKVPYISFVEVQFIKAEATGDLADLQAAVTASMELSGVVDTVGAKYVNAITSASQENIITEAYKAYFGFNFHETWANWRRTGFPSLSPSSACSDNGFNPSCSVPQRYLYAESERQTNSESVQSASASQGGDLLDVTLWAFQ